MNSTITSHVQGNTCLLEFAGYVSTEAAQQLGNLVEASLREGRHRFVFDFSAAGSVNSPGAAAILDMAMHIVDDFRGEVFVCGLKPLMHDLFDIVGILPFVTIVATREEALAASQ